MLEVVGGRGELWWIGEGELVALTSWGVFWPNWAVGGCRFRVGCFVWVIEWVWCGLRDGGWGLTNGCCSKSRPLSCLSLALEALLIVR